MGNSVTKSKDSNGYFEYIRKVRSAKLLAREKNLLYFYASMYNWEEGKASFASIELIAAWTGMSKASVNRAKKRLIELGWIKSFRRDRYSKVYVWVTNGQEDPNYDKQGFAEFHTYTSKKSVPSFEEAFGFTQDDYPSNQFDFDSFERAFQKEQERIFRDEFEQWVNQDPDEEIAW
jgi:hypothetical protein